MRPFSSFMKKMMILSKNWHFSVQKAFIYYTVNKSHHNSFILLVFSHVANFRFLTLITDSLLRPFKGIIVTFVELVSRTSAEARVILFQSLAV